MTLKYFGATDYDQLRINIDQPTHKIEISLSSNAAEYLNIGKIELFDNATPDTAIDIWGPKHQGYASLSSRAGASDRTDVTFEVSRGADIHSDKEKSPRLQILLQEPISNCTLTICNRSDYWGIRSKTLVVEAFERIETLPSGSYIKHLSFGLGQNPETIESEVATVFLGVGNEGLSESKIRSAIVEKIDTKSVNIYSMPWPLAMSLTELDSAQANSESLKIWAIFLLVQHAKTGDSSLLSLLNPEDKARLINLLWWIDHYALEYGLPTRAVTVLIAKGRKLAKQGRWKLARTIYEILYDIDKNNVDFQFGLGECFDSLKQPDQAKPLYFAAVKNREGFRPEHLEMFKSNHKKIRSRVEIYDFVAANIGIIRKRTEDSLSKIDHVSNDRVFCYWAQGVELAPPIVSACQRQLKKFLPKDSLIMLSERDIGNFVVVPDVIKQKLGTRSAFFSDILRLLLLSKYGGTWIDSTCYLTGPINTAHSSSEGSFTAFRIGSPSTLSVWYLKSRNDSWIIHTWKEAMLTYWENHDEETNYFIFHHVFEALYRLDSKFKTERDTVKQLPSSLPHEWYFKLGDDFDPTLFEDICKASNIHKLTHKTNPKLERADSFYTAAIRGL